MNKSVKATGFGVKVSLTGEVKKQNIVTMVQNCSTGKCDCMSDETKKKIENIEVNGSDGDVELSLSGKITSQEIEEAMAKSKVLNS